MRVLIWNIRNGGGTRIAEICRHIEDVGPDLLALTEFQTENEESLRFHLTQLGYRFIATSKPPDSQNGLLVASKWQLEAADDQDEPDVDRERWLAVRLDGLDLDILVVHIPGATDNKFSDGYGISGAARKERFWERIINYAAEHRNGRAILMGDFNTGLRIDAEGTMFKMPRYMAKLIDTGFVDTWRHLHPDARDYTWYSKRRNKVTGTSEDLNGFRLDYILVSPALRHGITDAAIQHGPRKAGTSDHSSVMTDIDVQVEAAHQVPAAAAADDETRRGLVAGVEPAEVQISLHGNRLVRFDLPPDILPDMACGVNGRAFVQEFQPTYFTAEWYSGVLKEVRVWGPRRLQDGSLGKRELDHRWKASVAAGGVNCADLPRAVAERIQSYIAGNGVPAQR